MHPAIEALRTELVSLMGEIIMAHDEKAAILILKDLSAKVDEALAAVEARS